MEQQKLNLEKKVSQLTSVFSEMLNQLAILYDDKEELEQELKIRKQDFDDLHIMTDCVFGRLNEAKKNLNAIYNNEDYLLPNIFIFDRSMIQNIKKEEAKEEVKEELVKEL